MKALYRKYRPTKLADIIGQDAIVNSLENSLKSGKISHAYLFTGPRGTGKTSIARIFAHEINNFKYEIEDHYVDIIEIDAASNTGVDNIRELRDKALTAPTQGKYKVYIIDEVHMLSKPAFNALLKTLEEPPKHVVFIMATTDLGKIIPTIISRSQVFKFHLVDQDTIKDHLKTIAKAEKINIEDSALDIITERGGGSLRDSISLLDQISSLSDQTITAELVKKSLGLPDQTVIHAILEAYQSGDLEKITTTLKTALENYIKPEYLVEALISYIIKNPSSATISLLERLVAATEPFLEAKLLLALTQNLPRPQNISQLPSSPTQPTPSPALNTRITPEKPISTPKNPLAAFSWESYLKNIKTKNSAVYAAIKNASYSLLDNTLKIAPEKKIYQNILEKPANQEILNNCLPDGLTITLAEENFIKKDDAISQINDIMGNVQEVTNGGENPFN